MKEDLNKPLYADYRKQMTLRFFWNIPIISRDKIYQLADMPLLVIGRILIVLAVGAIGWLNSYSRSNSFGTILICLLLVIIAEFFYTRKFVYRFGRFSVMWADAARHPQEEAGSRCDENGEFLNNEENRKAAKKTRRAFLVLFAGIIAVVLMYCFLWIGLSYLRVYSWHMGEIEEAMQITQKYDYVYYDRGHVGGETENGERISVQDKQRLLEIVHFLECEYVSSMQVYNNIGHSYIGFHTVFGYSCLVWFDEANMDRSLLETYYADTVIQLDEHWFYMRMDDGSRVN